MSYNQPIIPYPQRSVSVADLQSQVCVFSGWLRKRGKRNALPGTKKLFPWSKRFTVLCDGCMYSFANERSSKENGSFSLYGYTSVYRAPDVPAAEALWAFKIVHAQQEYKTYVLSASSQPDMKTWMIEIKKQMMRANNMNLVTGSASKPQSTDSFADIEEDIYGGGSSDAVDNLSQSITARLANEDSEGDEEDSDGEEFYLDADAARATFNPPPNRPIDIKPRDRPQPSKPKNVPDDSDEDLYLSDPEEIPVGLKKAPPRPAPQPKVTPTPPRPNKTGKPPPKNDDQEVYIYGDDLPASQPMAAVVPSYRMQPKSPKSPKSPPSTNDQELYIYGDDVPIVVTPAQQVIKAKTGSLPRPNRPVPSPPRSPAPAARTAPTPAITDDELYIYGDDNPPPPASLKPPMSSTNKTASLPRAPLPAPIKSPLVNDQDLYIYGDDDPLPPSAKSKSLPRPPDVAAPPPPRQNHVTEKKKPTADKTAKRHPPPVVVSTSSNANRYSTDRSSASSEGTPDYTTPPPSPSLPDQHAPPLPANHSAPGAGDNQGLVSRALYLGDSETAGSLIHDIGVDGAYLIRQGQRGWVLVVYAKEKTRKYEISCKEKMFQLTDKQQFSSIGDLVNYYTTNKLPVGVVLKKPYSE